MGTDPRHNMRISAALLVACVSVVAAFPAPTQNFTALPGRNAFPGKVTWGYYFLGNQPYQSPKTIIAQGVNYVCISFGNIGSSGTFEFPGGGCAGPDTEYCEGSIISLQPSRRRDMSSPLLPWLLSYTEAVATNGKRTTTN